jgi:hypothetical protein
MGAKTDCPFPYRTGLALNFHQPPILFIGEVVATFSKGQQNLLSGTDEGSQNRGFGPLADL